MSEKGRTLFYGLGAAYLLYLCYDLFKSGVAGGEATLPLTLFCILFGIVGVLLLLLAVKQYRKYMKEAMADEEGAADEETVAEAEVIGEQIENTENVTVIKEEKEE